MFAKNENGTIKYISAPFKDAADTPRNPYATGYGAKIPSSQLALINGKWQRVYVAQYSNSGSPWVQIKGERVCIRERDVESGKELFLCSMDFFKFVMGYIECLKWSTSGDYKDVEFESLEGVNLSSSMFNQTLENCFDFWLANLSDIDMAAQRYHDISGKNGYAAAGHDFWLTRAGHGAGFWDGDLPTDLGERLTEASKEAGNVEPYVGDDKLVYLMGGQRTLNERIAAFLTRDAGKSKPHSLMRLPEYLKSQLAALGDEHDSECWGLYLTDRFPAGGLWFSYADWVNGRAIASPVNVAHMLDHDGDLPTGVESDLTIG